MFIILPFFGRAQGIVVGDTVSSGIIYNNIKDTTLSFVVKGISTIDLDIDNDNVFDIRFYHEHTSSPFYSQVEKKVFPLTNLEFAVSTSTLYIDTIPLNASINSLLNWKGIVGYYLRNSSSSATWNYDYGFFKGPANYLGFRKILPNDTIYGWFLLDMTGTIKVKSYAYQSNNPFGIGIKENSKLFVLKLYPNPTNDKVEFVLHGPNSDLEIRLYNSLGQIVLEDKKANTNKFTLDVSNYANGLYYAEVECKEGISRAKFVKN